jgi:hypothetical protein
MTDEIRAKFLPEKEYERVGVVDYAKMATRQNDFIARYLEEAR